MIQAHTGDILTLTEGILVHGCNCQGVMGAGIAKLIRDKWPLVYQAYVTQHRVGGLRLGDIIAVAHSVMRQNPEAAKLLHAFHAVPPNAFPEKLIVVNAMTQDDYGRDPGRVYVSYDAVANAFSKVAVLAKTTGLPVHFPLIGCGLANGKWESVAARIEKALGPDIDAHLWVLPQK